MDEEKEEEQAVNIQQEVPTQNIREEEGGAALDHNNTVGEARQLWARRKVTNPGMVFSQILITTTIQTYRGHNPPSNVDPARRKRKGEGWE